MCKVQGVPGMCKNTNYMFQTFQNTKNHHKTPSEHGFININMISAPGGSQFRAESWKGMGARPLNNKLFTVRGAYLAPSYQMQNDYEFSPKNYKTNVIPYRS